MITNAITLAQLPKTPMEELMTLPLEQIAQLLEDVTKLKADVKGYDSIILQVLTRRLSDQAHTLRKLKGNDTGTVTFWAEGVKVAADLPKKVDWDQAKLKAAVSEIVAMGEDPAEYVTAEIKVAEVKYNAWPKSLRDLFTPARTVGVGKPTFKLERAAEEPV